MSTKNKRLAMCTQCQYGLNKELTRLSRLECGVNRIFTVPSRISPVFTPCSFVWIRCGSLYSPALMAAKYSCPVDAGCSRRYARVNTEIPGDRRSILGVYTDLHGSTRIKLLRELRHEKLNMFNFFPRSPKLVPDRSGQ